MNISLCKWKYIWSLKVQIYAAIANVSSSKSSKLSRLTFKMFPKECLYTLFVFHSRISVYQVLLMAFLISWVKFATILVSINTFSIMIQENSELRILSTKYNFHFGYIFFDWNTKTRHFYFHCYVSIKSFLSFP